eukprot:gene8032-10884_t
MLSIVRIILVIGVFFFILGLFVQIRFQLFHSIGGGYSSEYKLNKNDQLLIGDMHLTISDIEKLIGQSPYSVFMETKALNTIFETKPSINVVKIKAVDTMIKTNIYDRLQDTIENVPPLVKAWRSAKLDWHSLLPKHNSWWERFGTPTKEGKLPLLVNKEILVTNYLTRYIESGLSSQFGYNYGNMNAYSGCNSFHSSCMIHDEKNCLLDELCKWSHTFMLCVDSWSTSIPKELQDNSAINDKNPPKTCLNPKGINDNGFYSVDRSDCRVWVHSPAVTISIDSESQSMFYHWWASWSTLVEFFHKTLNDNRNTHYFVTKINDPMFFSYFGFLSDNCWRRTGRQVNSGLCFCNTHNLLTSQARTHSKEAANLIINYLKVDNISPPLNSVKIGIISRRRKRFILNEYELVQSVLSMGYECVLLPLEEMTIYEQMSALRSLDVLIGIHGSALDNSVFLHPGSVIVQLLPYKVEHRCTFQSSAQAAGVVYMEWQLKDKSKAYFHWDLLDQANSDRLKSTTKERYLEAGQAAFDNRETLMFWINQDIIVPLEEWIPLVKRAIKASQAKSRGVNIS